MSHRQDYQEDRARLNGSLETEDREERERREENKPAERQVKVESVVRLSER